MGNRVIVHWIRNTERSDRQHPVAYRAVARM